MKKLWLGLLGVLLTCGPVYGQTFTRAWDAALEAVPADSDQASDGANQIRRLKVDLRERLEDEHDFGDISGSDTNVHLEGSARVFAQSAAPTTDLGGGSLTNGRLWYDTDDDKFYVYDLAETQWEELVDGSDNMTLSTAQAATGAKTFQDLIIDQGELTYLNINSDTTADGDSIAYIADTSGGNVTLTLPALSGETGRFFVVAKGSSALNSFIIDGASTEAIQGSTTQTLTVAYDSLILLNVTTEWRIIGRAPPLGIIESQLSQSLQDKINAVSFFDVFGGDGSDGIINITDGSALAIADTDSDGIEIRQYSSINLENNSSLVPASTIKVFIIGVSGTTNIENGSFITMNSRGGAAGVGSGADGSPGGWIRSFSFGTDSSNNTTIISGLNLAGGGGGGGGTDPAGSGGDGGAAGAFGGLGGTGAGAPGNAPNVSAVPDYKVGYNTGRSSYLLGLLLGSDRTNYASEFLRDCMFSYGGGGGASGAADGGVGGGSFYGEFNGALTLNGHIYCNGSNGVNGSGADGSGGGGGGGFNAALYRTMTGSGGVSADAGGPGSPGGTGGNGAIGAPGLAVLLDVDG